MKKQLEQLHLNYFFFIDEPGCFTDMVSTIISDQYLKDRKQSFNEEKVRIISALKLK